jgi:hypothetical protein
VGGVPGGEQPAGRRDVLGTERPDLGSGHGGGD